MLCSFSGSSDIMPEINELEREIEAHDARIDSIDVRRESHTGRALGIGVSKLETQLALRFCLCEQDQRFNMSF